MFILWLLGVILAVVGIVLAPKEVQIKTLKDLLSLIIFSSGFILIITNIWVVCG